MCSVKRLIWQLFDAYAMLSFFVFLCMHHSSWLASLLISHFCVPALAEQNNGHSQFHSPFEIEVNKLWQVTVDHVVSQMLLYFCSCICVYIKWIDLIWNSVLLYWKCLSFTHPQHWKTILDPIYFHCMEKNNNKKKNGDPFINIFCVLQKKGVHVWFHICFLWLTIYLYMQGNLVICIKLVDLIMEPNSVTLKE